VKDLSSVVSSTSQDMSTVAELKLVMHQWPHNITPPRRVLLLDPVNGGESDHEFVRRLPSSSSPFSLFPPSTLCNMPSSRCSYSLITPSFYRPLSVHLDPMYSLNSQTSFGYIDAKPREAGLGLPNTKQELDRTHQRDGDTEVGVLGGISRECYKDFAGVKIRLSILIQLFLR